MKKYLLITDLYFSIIFTFLFVVNYLGYFINELIFFIEKIPYLYNQILKDNTAQSDSSINFANRSSDTNGKGLYYTADTEYGEDNTKIYYYRGRVENNWVSFGGYLWRIVRTTSEGGIKLVYSGDGKTTSSGYTLTTGYYNTSQNLKYYVGYTYNSTSYEGNQTSSYIKSSIDSWYLNNLLNFSNYLSENAIYCADRSNENINGNNITFPAYGRLFTNKRPTYACPSMNQSRYTVSDNGNGYLTYPIALLSADEVSYAGQTWNNTSTNSYIMDNSTAKSWATITPQSFTDKISKIIYINTDGTFGSGIVFGTSGYRPSITLKSCVILKNGDGTKTNPYIIADSLC